MQDLHENQERPYVEWPKSKKDSDNAAVVLIIIVIASAAVYKALEFFNLIR